MVADEKRVLTKEEFLAMDGEDAALLIANRYHALRARGCDAEGAVVTAVHPEIPVGDAASLLLCGCDPRTVLRILL